MPEGTDAEQTPDVNEEEGEREVLWIGLMFRNNVHLQPWVDWKIFTTQLAGTKFSRRRQQGREWNSRCERRRWRERGIVNWFCAQMCSNMVICFFTGHWFKIIFHKNAQEENWFICMLLQLIVYSKSYHFPHKMHRSRRVIEGDDAVFWQLFWNAIFS